MGHSIKSPQILFLNRAESRISCYRVVVISPACRLVVSFAFISPTEQNFQLPPQRFPSKSRPASQDFPAGFHKAHRQCTTFLFPNIVYFSGYGNPFINTSTSKFFEDLHSSFPTVVRDLFSPIRQHYNRTACMRIHHIHTS